MEHEDSSDTCDSLLEPFFTKQLLENLHSTFHAAQSAAKDSKAKDQFKQRIASQLWDMDSFDPFQIFEVTQRKCNILHVQVIKGTNVTKGWFNDLMDTPDPYLILFVSGTPNGKKRTKTIDNCINPIWNENFQFYLDPSEKYILELVFMDANYTLDEEMGRCTLPLDDIELHEEIDKVAVFENGSKIYLKLKITEDDQPDLRYSLALSEDEKKFLRERREKVREAMVKLLGEDLGPRGPREVPVISVLGSGGGFRAMTSFSGACMALFDEGIMDCVTYLAGLSGSTWYLSYLYSHPDFPHHPLSRLQNELKERVGTDWRLNLLPHKLIPYTRDILAKVKAGQPASFTDVFGHLVGDTLLGPERKNSTLSQQRSCLVNGAAPLPLYTCLNVKKDVSARVFQDWIEFSPYEVGVPKYGAFMKSEKFANKFYVGKLIKEFPECPLHFLQGVWGSAFCILFKRLISQGGSGSQANKNKDLAELMRDDSRDISVDDEMKTLDDAGNMIGLIGDTESTCSEDEFESHSSDESSCSSSRKSSATSNLGDSTPVTPVTNIADMSPVKSAGRGKLQRKKAIRRDVSDTTVRGRSAWKEKRRTTKRIKEDQQQSFWERTMNSLLSTNLLSTRAGRAGLVFNPLRGLNLKMTFPVSPFLSESTITTSDDDVDFKGFYESTELSAKKLYLVDSGLTFNLPFPLLLRPQRAVDLYLSFDFSGRSNDQSHPFKEILLAERWARLNHMPFPPVAKQVVEYEQEPIKELYVFRHPTDEYCPVILHFCILNDTFRTFKAPGVPRETEEEKKFADFEIFCDQTPYTIYNFCYNALQFDRLAQLMEFNVRMQIPEIKRHIAEAVSRKQRLLPKPPVAVDEIPKLRNKIKNTSIIDRLTRFVKSMSVRQDNDDDEFFPARCTSLQD